MRQLRPHLISSFPILITCIASLSDAKDQSVLIIGAGSSGIAAATKLLENNFTNVLVLEAEPRIGGRVNSIKFGDAYVDMGAEWCMGQEGNIVYNLAKDFNIFHHSDFRLLTYTSSGEVFDEGLNQELAAISISIYLDSSSQSANTTLGQYFIDSYRKIVHEKYGHDKGTLKLALEAMNFFLHLILANEGSFSCFDSAALTDFEDCPGDQQLNWNGRGFKTILYILMRKYPDPSKQLPMDNKIIFNKEVATVNWDQNSEGKVVVSCVDGSIFTADHVIFTPSIGVLKQRALSMFNPRLPINKLEAIDVIGIGAVAKVVMLFSSNWWGNETNFNFLWTEEDSKLLSSKFPGSVNSTSRTWLTDLTALTKVEQNPRVLMAWFTGEMVPVVELLPEETLIQGIIYMLNKVLGKTYSITKLNKITRSMWYSNPHFRGGYSFQTVRTRRASQDGTSSEDDLAEPLWDSRNRMVLHFAGEATHPTHYGTVHGAIETGYREAERIIDMYS